jgi:serine acetyltransferase
MAVASGISSTVSAGLTIGGLANVAGNLTVGQNVSVGGTLTVNGKPVLTGAPANTPPVYVRQHRWYSLWHRIHPYLILCWYPVMV